MQTFPERREILPQPGLRVLVFRPHCRFRRVGGGAFERRQPGHEMVHQLRDDARLQRRPVCVVRLCHGDGMNSMFTVIVVVVPSLVTSISIICIASSTSNQIL